MKTYLYLLPFKDRKYFKIGITTTTSSRIMKHHQGYDVDLDESMVVSANKNAYIKSLELELLSLYPKVCDNFKGKDGYTEIRDIRFLSNCIEYIKNKPKELEFVIKYFTEKESSNEKINKLKQRIKSLEIENELIKKQLSIVKNKSLNKRSNRELAKLLDNYKD